MIGEVVCAHGFYMYLLLFYIKTKPVCLQVDALVKGKQDELSTV